MGLHKQDTTLLLQLQQVSFLGGVGSIHINTTGRNIVIYSIDSKKGLTNLINHLEIYLLLTLKAADFMLFKKTVELMNKKAHLTEEG